ncbi:tigger transposable element-derived protein 1-like [Brachionichthys hirsutus]|uniref:tigger transposable element-derived protein 1-like n=1 Tax=Brachionichthys hirsutus TaxID=412623 RepID=UPI00360453F4
MLQKRAAASSPSAAAPKRRRKMLTIDEKIRLLDMLKEGKSNAAVGRHYDLNESSVRSIKREERKIRATADITVSKTVKRVLTPRFKAIVRMESALASWIGDCRKKNIPLDTGTIREKARQLYVAEENTINDPPPGTSTALNSPAVEFTANKGWFEKFQKRFNLKSGPLYGEAFFADHNAAGLYVNETFKTVIREGGYCPEQVFNMDSTGLFWKRMPSRTFIMQEEARAPGFEAYKDRVTLILCGNAAGFLLKPGLIYKTKTPRALKNKTKSLLPVHWLHNPTATITKQSTAEWFRDCFVPQAKLYLAEKGLEFKVVLFTNGAGGHDQNLNLDGVQIEHLPVHTAALIQPMDQGISRAFKALYTRNALQNLVEAMDTDEDFSVKECWEKYTIASCLQNIQRSLSEVKSETVSASWKKLWPEAVHGGKGFTADEIQRNAIDKAVKLATLLGGDGFSDMTAEDIDSLINAHAEPLTNDDLTEMTKSASEEEEDPEVAEEGGLTAERLADLVRSAKDLQSKAEEWDEQMGRCAEFHNAIDGAIKVYRNLKRHQKLPTAVFQVKKKPEEEPEEEPEEGPAEVVPSEEL